ncbi:sugar transferase [Geobacter sp.]|uniref:sugar transferase n=1 Tax=Geobacter sp. TaxID=46610 RepID=UPI00262B886F|nr:sugar transferase [Geobacter sp.]
MLKEQHRVIHKLALSLDAVIIGASFLIASNFAYVEEIDGIYSAPSVEDYLPLLVFLIPLWIITLKGFGAYDSMREKGFGRLFWTILEASLVATLIFTAAAFYLELGILTRKFVTVFFAAAVLLQTAEKFLVLQFLRSARRRGLNFRVLLIVGSGPRAREFSEVIDSHPEWGQKILGFIDEEEMRGRAVGQGRVIGTFDEMPRILEENVVDEVVFLMPRKWLSRLEEYVRVCEKIGVKATIAVDFFDTAIAKPVVKEVEGWPLLTFDTTPQDFFSLSLKRILDVVGAAAGLIVLSPLFLVIALAIKLASPGPVFFSQVRSGLRGRPFRILKFRTMIVNAEAKLKELQALNELEGPVFKIKNDPRITWIGRLLRKTSLDELPQLINVLKGDMSLVGPRPPLPSEVERYERWQRRRLSMRPGITCIHEVVAHNNKDFNVWMKMDLEYIDNWHFGLDLKLIARTVLAVVRGTGC